MRDARLLEAIVERTLDVLDDGSLPHVGIVHRVRLPVREVDTELAHRVADLGERRARGETSPRAVSLVASAAAYAREGRPFE